MDFSALVIAYVLPFVFFAGWMLIPVMIVMRLFRFKDVIVKLMEEVRKNPNIYKDNPEAVRTVMRQLQQSSQRPNRSTGGGVRPQPGKSATSQRRSSVPSSRSGSSVLHTGRNLSSSASSRRSTALRGTARMTQIRQEHKIKTTVAVFMLLGGVMLMLSTYFYGYAHEPLIGGGVLMAAGLYLLKTDVERV